MIFNMKPDKWMQRGAIPSLINQVPSEFLTCIYDRNAHLHFIYRSVMFEIMYEKEGNMVFFFLKRF